MNEVIELITYVRGSEEYIASLYAEDDHDYYEEDRILTQIDYAMEDFNELMEEVQ